MRTRRAVRHRRRWRHASPLEVLLLQQGAEVLDLDGADKCQGLLVSRHRDGHDELPQERSEQHTADLGISALERIFQVQASGGPRQGRQDSAQLLPRIEQDVAPRINEQDGRIEGSVVGTGLVVPIP